MMTGCRRRTNSGARRKSSRTCASTTALKASWGVSKSGYDGWFDEPINNAQLNTVAAYYDLVPAFQALLTAQGGDLEKFYAAVEKLAKEPLPKRHETLRAYLNQK
jgi:predicted aminopeptidase